MPYTGLRGMLEIAGILALPISLSSPTGELMLVGFWMPAMVERDSFSWLAPMPAKSVLFYIKFFPFNQFQPIEQRECHSEHKFGLRVFLRSSLTCKLIKCPRRVVCAVEQLKNRQ